MKRVDDFRLKFGKQELVPIMVGGMGVDISTAELALETARLGGIGHISDAMVTDVSDRRFDTSFVKDKTKFYKYNIDNADKSGVKFDLGHVAEATRLHVGRTMEAKRGDGMVFVNCMEKLTMNAPADTLRVRLASSLDAGVDGITLSAGLHLGSFALMEDHPRFRDAKLGIIVSSVRALQLFLRKNARLNRLPDFVVIEGPLAGGHLGFGLDWAQYDLQTIVTEIAAWMKQENLDIPLIAAGGAGPLHGAAVGRALGCAAVYVPRLAGVFCAFGMGNTDVRIDRLRSWYRRLGDGRPGELESAFAAVQAQAIEALVRQGFAPETIVIERSLALRYTGQQWPVVVPCGRAIDVAAWRNSAETRVKASRFCIASKASPRPNSRPR